MRKIYFILLIGVTVSCNNPKENTDNSAEQVIAEQIIETETVSQEVNKVKHIDTKELKEVISNTQDLQLLDVRTPGEISRGYIDNAILDMDYMAGEFQKKINTLDKTKPIVVYCASGGRSAKAAEILAAEGFKNVYNYKDGYSGWSAQ